jgi:hypothetical protein
MSKVWILSHGARVTTWPDTVVPTGKTVHYYADFDENTLRVNGLAAISAGNIAPTESFAGGAAISDYFLSAFTDAELAQHFASESSRTGGPMLTIGGDLPDDLPLCSNPNNCTAQHSCTGLFGLVQQDEIHLVACRGAIGQDNGLGWQLGNETAHNAGPGEDTVQDSYAMELNQHAGELLELAKTDPQGALAQFRSYPQATQAALIGAHRGITPWLEAAQSQGTPAGDGLWLDAGQRDQLLGNARPKNFEKAWADDYWRNVFWTWYTKVAGAAGPQEALLTLYDLMNDYYSDKNTQTATAVSEYSQGARGVVPACDAGRARALQEAIAEDSGIKSAMDDLWDSVVAQLDMVYPQFYQEVGALKDAIR